VYVSKTLSALITMQNCVSWSNLNDLKQNYAEAATWFRLAADQGHVVAQGVRGGLYFSGRGVLKDYVVAYMWLSLSAA